MHHFPRVYLDEGHLRGKPPVPVLERVAEELPIEVHPTYRVGAFLPPSIYKYFKYIHNGAKMEKISKKKKNRGLNSHPDLDKANSQSNLRQSFSTLFQIRA